MKKQKTRQLLSFFLMVSMTAAFMPTVPAVAEKQQDTVVQNDIDETAADITETASDTSFDDIDEITVETLETTVETAWEYLPLYDAEMVSGTQEETHRCDSTYGYESLANRTNGEKEQELYNMFEDAAAQFSEDFRDLESTEAVVINLADNILSSDEIAETYTVFRMDNPQYYWTSATVEIYTSDTAQSVYLCVDKLYLKGSVRRQNAALIEEKLAEYMQAIEGYTDSYTIALELHDRIIHAINYKYQADGITPADDMDAHSIIGVFNGEGVVCEGYAKTYQLLLNYAGIDNIYAIGYAGGNLGDSGEMVMHAWNYVKMDDGNYYGVDTTWDDTGSGNTFDPGHSTYEWYISPYNTGNIRYDYFLAGKDFYEAHWPLRSENTGYFYQYDLPVLQENDYAPTGITGVPKGRYFHLEGDSIQYRVLCNTDEKKEVEAYKRVNDYYVDDDILNVPSTVTYDGITYQVIGVGANLLFNTRDFTTLILNEGIKYIEDGAFSGFMYINATEDTKYIEEIYLPSTLEYIGGFAGQPKLKKIELAEGNQNYTMLDDVLYTADMKTAVMHVSCSEIKELTLPDTVETISQSAFEDSQYLEKINLPAGLQSIMNQAFYGCQSLKEIEIPENVETVAQCAFAQCPELVTATILGNTNVHRLSFENCSSLEAIHIEGENQYCLDDDGVLYVINGSPELATYPAGRKGESYRVLDSCFVIWDYAFEGAHYLEQVELHKNVSQITLAFYESSISTLKIDNDNPYFSCVGGMVFNKEQTELLQYLGGCKDESLVIPDTVTKIESDAFQQNQYLKSVEMSDSVTQIGGLCFQYCNALQSVRLSDSIQFDEEDIAIFAYCRNLRKVNIPKATKVIPSYMFEECNSLSEITIPENVVLIGEAAFMNCLHLRNIVVENSKLELQQYFPNSNGDFVNLISAEESTAHDVAEGYKDWRDWYDNSKIKEIDGIVYYENENDVTLLYSLKEDSGDVVIPESIDGKPVTSISDYAFEGDYTLTSITLPESIQTVGTNAFFGCSELTGIVVNNKNCALAGSNLGYDYYYKDGNISTFQHTDAVVFATEKVTVTAKKNSAALKYAKQTGLSEIVMEGDEILPGDANGDGVVNIKDSALIRRYAAGWDVDIDITASDVNADGVVNIKDSALVRRYAAGWNVTLRK
jgi:hypothetical protein